MSVTMELVGEEELFRKLRSLGEAGEKRAADAVNATALTIQATAKRSISGEQSSGRRYVKSSPRRVHVASSPGDAPNTDTGRLVNSIKIIVQGADGRIGTNLMYGKFLELGTQQMDPRPWLFPALENNRKYFREQLVKAVERAIEDASR